MKNLLLIISLSLSLATNAQVSFEKSIGSNNYDSGVSTIQTSGGGFVTVSNTSKYASPDISFVKMDSRGDTLVTKIVGGAGAEYCHSIQQASANEYLIVGTTNTAGAGDDDVFLIKTDSNGVMQYSRIYGGTGKEAGLSIQPSSDNGYLIAGFTESFGAGMRDVFIINVDVDGNVIWNKTFGGSGNDIANSVKRTTDGGYIITGVSNSFNANGDDVYLIKIDANGNKLWSKVCGGAGQDIGNSGLQSADGGYMIVGSTLSFSSGDRDMYIIKTDANGTIVFSNVINSISDDCANSVKQTSDGEYILTGWTNSIMGVSNLCLIKFNDSGDVSFAKKFGGLAEDKGLDVIQTSDGGYFITGETNTFGGGDYDSYLIKTSSEGTTSCVIKAISVIDTSVSSVSNVPSDSLSSGVIGASNDVFLSLGRGYSITTPCFYEDAGVTNAFTSENNYDDNFESEDVYAVRASEMNHLNNNRDFNFNVFPNPNDGKEINLTITSSKGEEILVVVCDALGREHFSKIAVAENEMEYLFALDPSEKLSSGIYFIIASSKKGSETKKLIVK
ncbi:MAG TPA: T9SS type A sorting domain-containing protein [Bacteroidia bacterium]|nr:T9SS type A sorting domain-containing protein [Bacteroidia bacterium]